MGRIKCGCVLPCKLTLLADRGHSHSKYPWHSETQRTAQRQNGKREIEQEIWIKNSSFCSFTLIACRDEANRVEGLLSSVCIGKRWHKAKTQLPDLETGNDSGVP